MSTLREKVQAAFLVAQEPLAKVGRLCRDACATDVRGDELGELGDMESVSRVLFVVCEQLAKPEKVPGPFAVAGALRRALHVGNVERAVYGSGEHYPPSRAGTVAGLNGLIAERNGQLVELLTDFERLCSGENIDSSSSGIAVAYRNVLRERDAFVAARDCA